MIGSTKFISIKLQKTKRYIDLIVPEVKRMDSFTSQIIAVVVFGVLITVLPGLINKWSDSRSQVR
jgi:hypothetical protein